MAKRTRKALYCAALCAVALVASIGGAGAIGTPTAAAAQEEECSDWEDWDNLRFWGLWSDEYHIPSSPNFNPHEDSRWWRPVQLVFAEGPRHGLERLTIKDHGHVICGWV